MTGFKYDLMKIQKWPYFLLGHCV